MVLEFDIKRLVERLSRPDVKEATVFGMNYTIYGRKNGSKIILEIVPKEQ